MHYSAKSCNKLIIDWFLIIILVFFTKNKNKITVSTSCSNNIGLENIIRFLDMLEYNKENVIDHLSLSLSFWVYYF